MLTEVTYNGHGLSHPGTAHNENLKILVNYTDFLIKVSKHPAKGSLKNNFTFLKGLTYNSNLEEFCVFLWYYSVPHQSAYSIQYSTTFQ